MWSQPCRSPKLPSVCAHAGAAATRTAKTARVRVRGDQPHGVAARRSTARRTAGSRAPPATGTRGAEARTAQHRRGSDSGAPSDIRPVRTRRRSTRTCHRQSPHVARSSTSMPRWSGRADRWSERNTGQRRGNEGWGRAPNVANSPVGGRSPRELRRSRVRSLSLDVQPFPPRVPARLHMPRLTHRPLRPAATPRARLAVEQPRAVAPAMAGVSGAAAAARLWVANERDVHGACPALMRPLWRTA